MKRAFMLLVCLSLLAGLLCGCGGRAAQAGERPSVVVTIYPIYDWVMNLLGDRASDWDVTLLLDSGTDMHSYQPSVEDIVTISACDLLIYVGGESDAWMDDALRGEVNPDMVVLNLLDILGDSTLDEETVEGMQTGEEDGEVPDEHVWLSLRNAASFCRAIRQELSRLDPGHAADYAANEAAYQEKLSELDSRYVHWIGNAACHTLLFADRFPFRYLCADYDLDYYAAFSGCSAETEASFETVAFLADKLKELDLPAVCVLERSEDFGALANTVVKAAGMDVPAISIDSMQSYTENYQTTGGYLGAMEYNLPMLLIALNGPEAMNASAEKFECIYYIPR